MRRKNTTHHSELCLLSRFREPSSGTHDNREPRNVDDNVFPVFTEDETGKGEGRDVTNRVGTCPRVVGRWGKRCGYLGRESPPRRNRHSQVTLVSLDVLERILSPEFKKFDTSCPVLCKMCHWFPCVWIVIYFVFVFKVLWCECVWFTLRKTIQDKRREDSVR